MAFCGNCGTEVQDEVKFCPSCGGEIGAAPSQQAQPEQSQQQYGQPPAYETPVVPGTPTQDNIRDAQDNKLMAVLSYIIFFIPLLTGDHKKSPFVKYHTNQGTVLFIVAAAYSIISSILRSIIRVPHTNTLFGVPYTINTTPGWLNFILWIGNLAIFVLCILGIVNAVQGKMKELPVIGKFIIIK